MIHDTTICAVATPPGRGAIAVIRMSGKESLSILKKIFIPAGKKHQEILPNTTVYGTLVDGTGEIDRVVVSYYRAPRSYTGEDVVEISCHGSPYIQQTILHLLIRLGAVMAQPGEFTLRAFLNGKVELSQAEAVADVVAASSEASLKLALRQMRGDFAREIASLRDRLLHFSSLLELELDFAEEDVEFADRYKLLDLISGIKRKIDHLTQSFRVGKVIKDGVPVAILGKTNVGKSTLLNALLREEKAIVSEIPGTTRDVIEDVIELEGVLFRFIDTAGIRKSKGRIEQIGIRRSFEKASSAAILLIVIDIREKIEEIQKQAAVVTPSPDQRCIVLLNKADLLPAASVEEKVNRLELPWPVLAISAKNKEGLRNLEQQLLEAVQYHAASNEIIITNARHYEALMHASEAAGRIIEGLKQQIPSDLIAMDMREVLHHLGVISGTITTEEILQNIFKNFCIGK